MGVGGDVQIDYVFKNQNIRELISARKTSHAQKQRPESPIVTLIWHAYKYKVYKLQQRPPSPLRFLFIVCLFCFC